MSKAKLRVEKELVGLSVRANNLELFLNNKIACSKVPPIQVTLMWLQLDKMREYEHILERRIEEWER